MCLCAHRSVPSAHTNSCSLAAALRSSHVGDTFHRSVHTLPVACHSGTKQFVSHDPTQLEWIGPGCTLPFTPGVPHLLLPSVPVQRSESPFPSRSKLLSSGSATSVLPVMTLAGVPDYTTHSRFSGVRSHVSMLCSVVSKMQKTLFDIAVTTYRLTTGQIGATLL